MISTEWLLIERYGEYMRHITFLPHICCAQFRHQFAWFVNCRNVCTCVYSTCIVHATRIVYCSGLPQPQLRYGCLVGSDPFQGRDFSFAQVPTIHYLKTTQLLSTTTTTTECTEGMLSISQIMFLYCSNGPLPNHQSQLSRRRCVQTVCLMWTACRAVHIRPIVCLERSPGSLIM